MSADKAYGWVQVPGSLRTGAHEPDENAEVAPNFRGRNLDIALR